MIRFINHACFLVYRGRTVLACDPWVSGPAFDNGWRLIVEADHPSLRTITHIWYSHEHPDHFSIGFLRSIPEARRPEIEILYQRTADGRVAAFCRKLGFRVREVASGETVALGDEIHLTIGKIPFYDSWAFIETPEFTLLNSNDCILENPERVKAIARQVHACDILFTQFSYANWQDRRANPAARQALARDKLERIKLQCAAFGAKFVVPFASFVYFSHAENAYMNADINTPEDAVRYISQECSALPILLTPNEEWDGVSPKWNAPALDYWRQNYELALEREPERPGPSVPVPALAERAAAMIERVRTQNNFLLIRLLQLTGILRAVSFRLSDLGEAVAFDWVRGFTRLEETPAGAIELHSSSLAFVFDQDFGVDTLNVNARFETDLAGKRRLIRLFSVLALKNTGRNIRLRDLGRYLNFQFLRQGLRTVGLLRSG